MAISIAPTALTPEERAKVIAKKKTDADAYTKSIALRRQMAAALNASTKAVGAQRADQTWGARYRSAVAAEKAARGRYDTGEAYYKQYGSDYNRFMALAGQNPDTNSALSKLTPYDPQTAAERLSAQTALNQALVQIKQGKDRLAEDYQTAGRQLDENQGERFRGLLANFAGRGMAYSSGYGKAYGDETADYTQRRTELDTANQRGLAQAGLDEGNAQSSYQAAIAAILANTTGRLAANAGGLGMAGNRDLPLLLEIAKRRLTATGGS